MKGGGTMMGRQSPANIPQELLGMGSVKATSVDCRFFSALQFAHVMTWT
jgi:hypothetical protein